MKELNWALVLLIVGLAIICGVLAAINGGSVPIR
jgi:hypothetical protein